jgi:hypothetical protein
MKKIDREIYVTLAAEIDWNLCGFCRYNRCEGSACEDGWSECEHPLWEVSEYADSNVDSPGCDCWGFRPWVNVRDCADIVGLILSLNYDPEKVVWWKEDKQIKVAGLVRK